MCDSMHYLYNDTGLMYPQLVTAACKAESEQEDQLSEGVQVRSAWSEGKDGIVNLREQIASCRWEYRSHRKPQPVTLNSWEVQGMVMETNVIPGAR